MPRQQMRLSDAIEEFIPSRQAQGLSKMTLKTSRVCLSRLLEATGNIYVNSITPRHIDGYFGMNASRWSAGTVNLYRAHLNGFFVWCRQRRYLDRDNDPMEGTRRRKTVKQDRLRIPVAEFPRLLDAAEYPRNRMVIALGLYLFLRASEIRTLKVSDVHLDLDEISVTVHKAGGEVDRMPISTPLRQELIRWLTFYAEQVGSLNNAYLVPALRSAPGYYDYEAKRIQGTPTAERVLRPLAPMSRPHTVVLRVLEKAGYPNFREGCHTLRRSGARALFDELAENGHDRALEIVSAMLHHQEMGMTQHYIGVNRSRAKRDELLKGRQIFDVRGDNVTTLRAVE